MKNQHTNNQYTQEALEYMFNASDAQMRPELENAARIRLNEKNAALIVDTVARNNALPIPVGDKLKNADEDFGRGFVNGTFRFPSYLEAITGNYSGTLLADAKSFINKAIYEDSRDLDWLMGEEGLAAWERDVLSKQVLKRWEAGEPGNPAAWAEGAERPTQGFTRVDVDTSDLNAGIMESAKQHAREEWNVRLKQRWTENDKAAGEWYNEAINALYVEEDPVKALELAKGGLAWLQRDMGGVNMAQPDYHSHTQDFAGLIRQISGGGSGGASGGGGGGNDTDLLNDIEDIRQWSMQGKLKPAAAVTTLNQIRREARSSGVVNAARDLIDDLITEINPAFKGITSGFIDMMKGLKNQAEYDPIRKFQLGMMEDKYLHIIQQNAAKGMSRSDAEKSVMDMYGVFAGDVGRELTELAAQGIRGSRGEGKGKAFFEGEHDLNKYYVFEGQFRSSGDITGTNFFTGETYNVFGDDFMAELVEKSADLMEEMLGGKIDFYDWAPQSNVSDDPGGLPIFKDENGRKLIFRSDGTRLHPVEVTLDDRRHIIDEKPRAVKETIPDAELAAIQAQNRQQLIRMQNHGKVEAAKNLAGTARTRALQKLYEDGIIPPDEYAELVPLTDAVKAFWDELTTVHQGPGAKENFEKFAVIAELIDLADSEEPGDREKYREKYDEAVMSFGGGAPGRDAVENAIRNLREERSGSGSLPADSNPLVDIMRKLPESIRNEINRKARNWQGIK